MSDPLGEALARAHEAPHYDLGWQVDPDTAETIVAAARNWHTLTKRINLEQLIEALHAYDFAPSTMASHDDALAEAARLVVDALTDTTDDE